MRPQPKLSEFVEIAAAEYVRETGSSTLDPRWIAEFFQDCGVLEAYPRQDLVAFHALVQKAIANATERSAKQARLHAQRMSRRERKTRGS